MKFWSNGCLIPVALLIHMVLSSMRAGQPGMVAPFLDRESVVTGLITSLGNYRGSGYITDGG